ncbi:MAG: CDP-diacylglycerol--glycerol-3-phosphate 3-phosphatidyltransferase [Clostridia bacterium]|nr:CDP-diacylglycerol--glycerol-3-phosphate 3-phosphatidyltransferase [Clostridia bacterium]
MNTPNKISIFRIFLVPVFLGVFLMDIPFRYLIAVAIFILGAISDAVDGHLARKHNLITVFGQFLDPIADKMLVTAGLLAFMKDGLCNIWIVMAILVREFVMTSLRLIASAQGVVIPANIFGKIKTVMQMTALITVMIFCGINELITLPFSIPLFSNIFLGITAVMGIISAIIYYKESKNIIDFTK